MFPLSTYSFCRTQPFANKTGNQEILKNIGDYDACAKIFSLLQHLFQYLTCKEQEETSYEQHSEAKKTIAAPIFRAMVETKKQSNGTISDFFYQSGDVEIIFQDIQMDGETYIQVIIGDESDIFDEPMTLDTYISKIASDIEYNPDQYSSYPTSEYSPLLVNHADDPTTSLSESNSPKKSDPIINLIEAIPLPTIYPKKFRTVVQIGQNHSIAAVCTAARIIETQQESHLIDAMDDGRNKLIEAEKLARTKGGLKKVANQVGLEAIVVTATSLDEYKKCVIQNIAQKNPVMAHFILLPLDSSRRICHTEINPDVVLSCVIVGYDVKTGAVAVTYWGVTLQLPLEYLYQTSKLLDNDFKNTLITFKPTNVSLELRDVV